MLLQSTTAGSFSDQRLSLWVQIKFEPHPVWSPLGVYFEDPRPFPMGVAPGISWSGKWTGFRERSSGKTVSFFQGASHAPRALSTAMSFFFPWMSKKNSKYAKYFFLYLWFMSPDILFIIGVYRRINWGVYQEIPAGYKNTCLNHLWYSRLRCKRRIISQVLNDRALV